jgi:hypothetical protein
MRDPCKRNAEVGLMTYGWDDVDVSITIQRDRIDKEQRKGSEVVVPEPLRSGYGELLWYATLFLR